MNLQDQERHAVMTKRIKQAFVIFALIAAFFLLTEHQAHISGFLPWLLLAACPLMHLFMHHGKHAHHSHDARDNRSSVADGDSRHG